MEGLPIEFPGHRRVTQQGLDFGGEEEEAVMMPVVKRLLAQSVSSQEQLLAWGIPESEGEHAAEVLDAAFTLFFVQVQDNFGITLCRKAMPTPDQIRTEFAEIVDLTVEDDTEGAVASTALSAGFVQHGLTPAREIDDGEAPHPEAYARRNPNSLIVRSAVNKGPDHPL
jgi:hypothetical protein